jgi:hypothetical protein
MIVSFQSLLSYGTKVLYDYLHSGPTKLMLLLPQENDIARTVAAYAGLKQWGTLQVIFECTTVRTIQQFYQTKLKAVEAI